MTQFEFVSAFISILFGLGLAHLLTGAIGEMYAGRLGYQRFAYSVNTLVGLVLNWWVMFLWKDSVHWTFLAFLVLVIWALAFFTLAVALYPPDHGAAQAFPPQRRVYLLIWLGALAIDVVQTGLRGQLLQPPYYLVLVAHYVVLALSGLAIRNERLQAVLATYFPISQLLWSLGVRNLVG